MCPELLILDEPAAGLDPAARREFLEVALTLAATFLLCVVGWALLIFCGLYLNRQPTTLEGCQKRKWLIHGSPFVMWTGVVIYNYGLWNMVQDRDRDVPSVSRVASGMVAKGLPKDGLLCWLTVLLVAGAFYLLLGHQFSKMELPQPGAAPR